MLRILHISVLNLEGLRYGNNYTRNEHKYNTSTFIVLFWNVRVLYILGNKGEEMSIVRCDECETHFDTDYKESFCDLYYTWLCVHCYEKLFEEKEEK